MRRIALSILSLFAVACSSEIDEVSFEEVNETVSEDAYTDETDEEKSSAKDANSAAFFAQSSFTIPEHSEAGSTIGFLSATDASENPMTYTLASDADIYVDEHTGELKVGATLKLDFECTKNIEFSVSAYHGKTITEKTISLTVQDVDEMALLTTDQEELISYFQYLTLWKGPYVTEIDENRKWTTPMKLHLDGTITDDYRTTVENVISQYNALFTDSDFRITLTEDADDANASLFFGTKNAVADVWPDMYKIIKNGNYDGYAKTPSQNSIITSTRIWISNPIGALFKHEMGHALGFGHSNHCEGKKSIMCSTVSTASAILPMEANVIRYQYHRDLLPGLSETEIEQVLANIILNER